MNTDVVVVGGGQAGLAAGFYLRRAGRDFVILDAGPQPGGAWTDAWDTLRLFSPARYSSLPGRMMPPTTGYPPAAHVVDYLTHYEKHYDLPIQRPVTVEAVTRGPRTLTVHTDQGDWTAAAVISATGTWSRPFVPAIPGRFGGRQLHTAGYRTATEFAGQRVVVVGGGNSGAQIAADLAHVAEPLWLTQRPPRFLPDHIDGKALFDIATSRKQALDRGETQSRGIADLGDIVAVPPVRAARDSGSLKAAPMFTRLEPDGPVWTDGKRWAADAIIWCTGFRPALSHLAPLKLRHTRGHIPTDGPRVIDEPRLHLLGYGDWTGPASATLIGVGPTAKAAVADLSRYLADR